MADPAMHLILARLARQDAKVVALERRFAHAERRANRRARDWRPLALLPALLVALAPLAVLAASPFTDLNPGSTHNDNIEAIYSVGVTSGCVSGAEYCPNDTVTRQEMASFLARLGGLGSNPPVANARTAQVADTATTAARATTADTAQNAAQLGGQPASAYVLANSSPSFADLTVTGTINRAYSPGTSNRAAPVAFAYVATDGTVTAGTPNLTVTYNAAEKRYEITIAGEDYTFRTHPTFAIPNTTNRDLITSNNEGKLIIYANDPAGNRAQSAFNLLIFKP